ncbi:hypothetical protein ES703_41181 [subsurface metagenome]
MMVLEVISPSSSNLQAVGSSVPLPSRGLVHVYGRNNMATAQKLGIGWVVWDPDGIVADEYSAWEDFTSAPGEEHHFRTPTGFDINKSGTWTIEVALFMNRDDPVAVDSYQGTLCIVPTEIPPEYVLIQHTIYPWSYTFEGNAEVCTFDFKLTPEQIPITEWFRERIVNALVSELEKEGARLLEIKVYEDTTPTFWTNYRVEVTATASPLAWNLIILSVLAILFVVAIYFTIKLIDEVFFKRKPLSEETKRTFSRDTLTAMILDLEPETPTETLEGMSDQELRDELNALLAELAPPVEWWPLAIIGVLGVLGVGAAVALGMPRKSGGHNPGIATSIAAATWVLEEEKRKKDKKEKPKGLRW